MGITRIAYVCGFSNSKVREKLNLKSNNFRNFIYSIFGREKSSYIDYAIWNTAFFQEFEKSNDYEFYVVSPHAGMKVTYQNFTINNIHYSFFKNNYSLLKDTFYSILRIRERTQYRDCRKKIARILQRIQPDMVILCGAEQPYYSPCILDIKNIPVYVLFQTLVSIPSLRGMMKDSEIFCKVENIVFPRLKYIAAEKKYLEYLKESNYKTICLPIAFPTFYPQRYAGLTKIYDFVFYAASLSKNKGIEDVLIAFNSIHRKHRTAKLLVSGKCDDAYLAFLKSLVDKDIKDLGHVKFMGLTESIDEKYKIVQTARIAVLPGITAPINSTVRESMLMGLPTIVYETSVTHNINKDIQRLLEAKMESVYDLCVKMDYAIEHPKEMNALSIKAYEYASEIFNNKKIVAKLYHNIDAIMAHYYNNVSIPNDLIIE